jgi:hypothetical protein
MSYTEDLILSIAPINREGDVLWLAKVMLLGLSQHIPNYLNTGKELHSIGCEGWHE